MMEWARQPAHPLRNTPVRKIVRALEKDGFNLERKTRTGGHIYYHSDGRMTVVHYHKGSDTLTRKTLQSVLDAVCWSKEDLKRLGLLK